MGTAITITADDGFTFDAYLAEPAGTPKGGIVVIQEIFGVNSHIREVCDGYAADGYTAIAPALFDRLQKGVELTYEGDDVAVGLDLARTKTDFNRAVGDVLDTADYIRSLIGAGAKVATTGYCWGGVVSIGAGMQGAGRVQASVSYYGTGTVNFAKQTTEVPLQLHFGDQDGSIPEADIETMRNAWPSAEIFVYNAHHGFNCTQRSQHDPASATLAKSRVLEFLSKHIN
jgi:carboxymethylenebutenolidase